MPTDYSRNKPMHAREVRYERNERGAFPGKRDWHRVAGFDRSPGLNSVGASYEPPNKRRPTGRHGFTGENGRYNRDHSRMSEHQPMFNPGYPNFAHKNERYVVGSAGYANGRNGFKDAEEEHFRDRGLSQERVMSPSYHLAQPMHSYSSVFEDGHRGGSRYGWDALRQQRPSCSPDVPDRRVRWDVTDKEYEARFEGRFDARVDGRIEGRFDRYGSSRESGFSDPRKTVEGVERAQEFGRERVQQSQYGLGHGGSFREDKMASSSPRKRTRLGWGQGLAKYEQKKVVEADPPPRGFENGPRSFETAFDAKEQEACYNRPCGAQADDSSHVKHSEAHDLDVDWTMSQPKYSQVSEENVAAMRASLIDPAGQAVPIIEMSNPVHQEDAGVQLSPQCPEMLEDGIGPQDSVAAATAARESYEVVGDAPENCHRSEEDIPDSDLKREPSAEPASAMQIDRVSKDAVLIRVEQLEFQIDSIEKELARLDVQTGEGMSTEPHEDESELASSLVSKDIPVECGQETKQEKCQDEEQEEPEEPEEMEEEKREAGSCSEADVGTSPALVGMIAGFEHLFPTCFPLDGRKLYTGPQEAPIWGHNEEVHRAIKCRIMEQMLRRKQAVKFREQSLVLKYRLLQVAGRHEQAVDVFKRDRSKGSRRADCNQGLLLARTSLRALDGDPNIEECNSKWSMRRLLIEPVRQLREAQKMPAMILDERDKPHHDIVTANRLLEDPIKSEQDRKIINPWTPEERKIFLEKFGLLYKNFSKIASFLEHKTVGDCIEFYYRNQKSEEFAKLRKKHKLSKKRQLRYLAPAAGKLREANTAAINSTVASAASSVGRDIGKPSRSSTLKVVDQERLSAVSDCVTLDAPGKHAVGKAGNISGSIVTGVCSLSSDAPLTPSRIPSQKTYAKEDRHKGARGAYSRREYGKAAGEDAESEWTDDDRKLFLDALLQFGKDFRLIALQVHSKTEDQCKAFFCKTRKRLKLDKILERHQMAQATSKIEVNRPSSAFGSRAMEVCRTSENDDMDVSTVVDYKEGNVTDADDTMEDTSAAPAAMADSPVSSVITSPGLASMSSPLLLPLKANEPVMELKQLEYARDVYQKPGNDWPLFVSTKSLTGDRPCLQNSESRPPPDGTASKTRSMESCDQRKTAAEDATTNPVLSVNAQPVCTANHGLPSPQQPNGFHQVQGFNEQEQVLLQYQVIENQAPQIQKHLQQQILTPSVQPPEGPLTTNNQKLQVLHQQPETAVPVTKLAFPAAELGNSNPPETRQFQQQQSRPSDFKLFGVPLVSTTGKSKEASDPVARSSWCSGSAEALDRRQAAAVASSGGAWQQVLNPGMSLWKAAAAAAVSELKPASSLATSLGYSSSTCLQQQQQGLKDGLVYGSSHLLQLANGSAWGHLGSPTLLHHHQQQLQVHHQQQQLQVHQQQQLQVHQQQQQFQARFLVQQQQQLQVQRPNDPGGGGS